MRRMLEHWACFDCRKMFRKPSRWDSVRSGEQPSTPQHICPQCREEMRDMGRHFEPPRRSNQTLWEVMRVLSDNGYTFHCDGCKTFIEKFIFGESRPNLKLVKERLSKLRKVSEGERLLRKIDRNLKSKRPRLLLPDMGGCFVTEDLIGIFLLK